MALPKLSASTETETETPYPYLMPRPGRPSLYSPERTATICAIIIKDGISDSAAGALAGVTASTLSRWKLEHEEFALELEAARARFELEQVRAIRNARKRDGTVDWRAVAWLLKYSSPEGYGPASRRRKVREQDGRKAQEPEREREKCANVPETPGGRASGPGHAAATGARAGFENDAIVPETPREGRPGGPGGRPNGSATGIGENCAILPETPEMDHPAAPKLSRRERRAEERRVAKQARQSASSI
ncbi:MAG TPA: hypothetical protein VGO11_18010 [Chthoniobacteraceae bacterium]|jgi:hypothetical protein|nr:hypothetical protein [Chthoniobacteraceae bacterium]